MTGSTRPTTTGDRRRAAACAAVAVALLLCAAASGEVPSLRLHCDHAHGLVAGDETTTVYLRLFAWEAPKRPLVLKHKLTDWWGRTAARGAHKVNVRGQWVRPVSLKLDRYGPYTFEAELVEAGGDAKAGGPLAAGRLRVVRTVPVDRLTPQQRAGSSIGVNTHYQAKWPALAAMGIHWARDYCWGWLKDAAAAPRASNGVDFAPIAREAAEAGVTVLPCMSACFRTADKKRYVADAAGIRGAYERLSRAFPDVPFWELDNESDLQFHGSTVGYEAYMASYVGYIRHAAEGLRAAGGRAKVVLNGDAGIYYDRTVRLLKSAAKDDFAVVNCHYYTGTVAPELSRKDYNTGAENPEGAATFLDRLRAISQLAHSHRRESWLTEVGWDATYGPAVGERLQAIYLARMYLLARFCGVDKTFWFFDRDTDGTGKFASSGLIDRDDNVRPAGAAMAAVSKFTALAEYAGSIDLGPDRWCLLFRRPGGGWLAAAWSVEAEHPLPAPLAKAKRRDLFGNTAKAEKLTPEVAYFQLDGLPPAWEAQRTAEWLAATILTTSPGSSVSVAAKLPPGAAGGWGDLPAGVTGGKWSTGGGAKSELTCAADVAIGEYRLTAVAEGENWRRSWPLVLRVIAPLKATSDPYWPGGRAELSLRTGGRQAVDVELSVPAKLGKMEPPKLTATPAGAKATFLASKAAAGPVTVTAKLAGGATMTHDLRPGRIDVIQVGRVKLDGDLGDWPKAAALVGRAFESAAGLDPGVRVGWSEEGIWLAARLAAKDLAAGDPKQFWDWTCVELFVDTSGGSAGGWGDKAHQFWLTPVRDGGSWRLYAGEWKRGEAIDATVYDDRRVRTSVRVEGESVTLEALIPAEAIGAKPQAGFVWRAAVTAHVTRPNEANVAAAWPRSKRSGLLEGASFWGQLRLVRADGSVPAGSAAAAAPGPPKPKRQFPGPERWEKNIRAFEARDKKSPPPKGEILFVGSSSIVGWDTKKWFPDLKTINRGFGGSDVSDSLHFADRIILPYRPRTIVLYAGDNDISRGKSPRRVLADYKALVAKVHTALPKTRIVFVPIKPSLARWKLVGKMREANALIRAVTEADERLGYVDIDTPMIGADGRPRGELFKKDGLHLSEAGYKLWSSLLRPHLKPPGEDGRSEAPPPGPRKPRKLVDAGPPFGKLPLVDEIDCGKAGGHEFEEDPPGASRVETVLGRPCRVLPNEGGPRYFAYRIGRGCGLKAGACYVLSVEYPEDRPRTMFVLNRGAETARGLSTGGAIGDVLYTYTNNNVESLKIPLSKAHRTWKAMFTLHDRFPGIRQPRGAGSRPEMPKDGFLVIFAQPKAHSAPMSAGAAVARVRLFELPDPSRHYVKLRRPPAPLPRRHVFWREEMSDGMVQSLDASQRACREPSDFFEYKARRMRFLGVDVFCKDLLEFGHNQGWDAGAYGGNDWYWASKHPKRWRRILAIAARHGLAVLPYYEWCGGVGQRGLGRQKRCVSLAGKKVYTHIEWSEKANVDLTDPETLADAIKLLDATIVRHKDRAKFVGAWFRTRPSNMPISFSDRCLALFAKDAGADGPVTREKLRADAKLLGRYYDWWFEKRKAFLVALRDHLRAQVGEDMAVLLTACGAEPGPPIHGLKKRVITDDVAGWSKLLADPAHKQVTPYAYGRTVAAAEHLAAATRMPATWGQWEWQHSLPPPDPRRYRDTPGVMMTLPFNRAYTVCEPRAFDAFRTPTGLAIARHYPLNETVMDRKLGYFVCDVERAGPFCMLAEARAVATGDPTHIGYLTAAVFTRGFPEHVRRFNAAFLALPALPSTRLPEACADGSVVVRAIETKARGVYLAVVNVGLAARSDVTVKLPRGGKLTDAATGQAIEARDGGVTLSLGPCELRALHVE